MNTFEMEYLGVKSKIFFLKIGDKGVRRLFSPIFMHVADYVPSVGR